MVDLCFFIVYLIQLIQIIRIIGIRSVKTVHKELIIFKNVVCLVSKTECDWQDSNIVKSLKKW